MDFGELDAALTDDRASLRQLDRPVDAFDIDYGVG